MWLTKRCNKYLLFSRSQRSIDQTHVTWLDDLDILDLVELSLPDALRGSSMHALLLI